MSFFSLNESMIDDVNKKSMNGIFYSDYSEKKMKNDHDSFEQQIQSEVNDNDYSEKKMRDDHDSSEQQIQSEVNSNENDFSIAIVFETQENAKIRLNDLNDEDKERLMQEAMKKKSRTHRMKFYHKLKFEGNTIQIEFIIKYLHSWAKFDTLITINLPRIAIVPPSMKSTKSLSNSSITRAFVDLTKNTIKCKIWKIKATRKFEIARILTRTSTYLIINDKTINENTDWSTNQDHHLTNYMSFILTEKNVWFTEKLIEKAQRNKLAQRLCEMHQKWRVQALNTYKNECKTYFQQRLIWKWALLEKVMSNHLKFHWSSNVSMQEIKNATHLESDYIKTLLHLNVIHLIESEEVLSQ